MPTNSNKKQDAIYNAMQSIYENSKNWQKNLSPKEIMGKVKGDAVFKDEFYGFVEQAIPRCLLNKVVLYKTPKGIDIRFKPELAQEEKLLILRLLRRFSEGKTKHHLQKSELKDFDKNSSIGDKYSICFKPPPYRSFRRYFKELEKKGKIKQFRKGQYTTDIAISMRKKENLSYKKITEFTSSNISGRYVSILLGRELGSQVSYNPIYGSPGTKSMIKQALDMRLKTHNNREIAKIEADLWVDSFINSVLCAIETTGPSISLKSGKMMTTARQELPIALISSAFGKEFLNTRLGIDAFVLQAAIASIWEVFFGLVDLSSLASFGDSELILKIRFSPSKWIETLEKQAEVRERLLNLKRVYRRGILPTNLYEETGNKSKLLFADLF